MAWTSSPSCFFLLEGSRGCQGVLKVEVKANACSKLLETECLSTYIPASLKGKRGVNSARYWPFGTHQQIIWNPSSSKQSSLRLHDNPHTSGPPQTKKLVVDGYIMSRRPCHLQHCQRLQKIIASQHRQLPTTSIAGAPLSTKSRAGTL